MVEFLLAAIWGILVDSLIILALFAVYALLLHYGLSFLDSGQTLDVFLLAQWSPNM